MNGNDIRGLHGIQAEEFKFDLKPDWDLLNVLNQESSMREQCSKMEFQHGRITRVPQSDQFSKKQCITQYFKWSTDQPL